MTEKTDSAEEKIDVISAIMLAVIIVAIAWCAYQSTLWNGIQTFKLHEVNSYDLQFVLKLIQQEQYSAVDAMTFIEYVNALHDKNQELGKFYFERFNPEMKAAVQAWLETNPLNDSNAPLHPFDMAQYNRTFLLEAQQFDKMSELTFDEAQQANRNSDNYILLTVIYSGVLFIGGILSRVFSRQVRLILLITGLGITSVNTIVLFFMPVAR